MLPLKQELEAMSDSTGKKATVDDPEADDWQHLVPSLYQLVSKLAPGWEPKCLGGEEMRRKLLNIPPAAGSWAGCR